LTTKLFLDKEDHLLRRTESIPQQSPPPGGSAFSAPGRIVFTVSNLLLNSEMKDEVFRLECSAGFQQQPLQTARTPRTQNQQQQSGLPVTGSQAPG
jgi:hypothetical protein